MIPLYHKWGFGKEDLEESFSEIMNPAGLCKNSKQIPRQDVYEIFEDPPPFLAGNEENGYNGCKRPK